MDDKNQKAAAFWAVVATVLFTLFESQLHQLMKALSIDLYIIVRYLLATVLLFTFLRVGWRYLDRTGLPIRLHLRLNPLGIDNELWAKASLTVASTYFVTIAFANSTSQVFVYPLFFLHPVWQLVATKVVGGKWPKIRNQVKPIGLIIVGALLFTLVQSLAPPVGDKEAEVGDPWVANVFAFFGGACFAFANEYSSYISSQTAKRPFAFMFGVPGTASSCRLTAYTMYPILLLAIIAWPFISVTLHFLSQRNMLFTDDLWTSFIPNFPTLLLVSLLAMFATWFSTASFKLATHSGRIAAIDGFCIPVGVALEWVSNLNRPTTPHPYQGWLYFLAGVIALGAFWSGWATPEESNN